MNSFSSLLVICAVAAVSASIHEVNTVGRTHPRNSNDQPMLVSDIYAASEYFYGKESAVPAPEAIDPNNVPTLKVHHGLSATCTSKICDMFYYALVGSIDAVVDGDLDSAVRLARPWIWASTRSAPLTFWAPTLLVLSFLLPMISSMLLPSVPLRWADW